MKKKKKNFLTVYTVSYSEYTPDFGVEHQVIGSFLRRGDVIRECAKEILGKVARLKDIRKAFYESSDEDISKILEKGGIDLDKADEIFLGDENLIKIPQDIRTVLMEYLVDIIGGYGVYEVESDNLNRLHFRFDVDENDVECKAGLTLWTCVTSGRDDDQHDSEFENAFPETFLTCEEAIQCAVDNLRQHMDGYERKEIRETLNEAQQRLKKDGHYEFRLNDQMMRFWDVWRNPMDIGQGVKKYGKEEKEDS